MILINEFSVKYLKTKIHLNGLLYTVTQNVFITNSLNKDLKNQSSKGNSDIL